jgi:hypothetical protein
MRSALGAEDKMKVSELKAMLDNLRDACGIEEVM